MYDNSSEMTLSPATSSHGPVLFFTYFIVANSIFSIEMLMQCFGEDISNCHVSLISSVTLYSSLKRHSRRRRNLPSARYCRSAHPPVWTRWKSRRTELQIFVQMDIEEFYEKSSNYLNYNLYWTTATTLDEDLLAFLLVSCFISTSKKYVSIKRCRQ
jgi:hypothetical protein